LTSLLKLRFSLLEMLVVIVSSFCFFGYHNHDLIKLVLISVAYPQKDILLKKSV
jgi:hypothetical protein